MKKFNKQQIYAIITMCVLGTLVLIVTASILFDSYKKSQADYDGFKNALRTYMQSNTYIDSIDIVDSNIFDVKVKDNWYYTSEINKLKFCNTVREYLYVYATKYGLIYDDNDIPYVTFYDTSGIRLTDQDMYEFKILH